MKLRPHAPLSGPVRELDDRRFETRNGPADRHARVLRHAPNYRQQARVLEDCARLRRSSPSSHSPARGKRAHLLAQYVEHGPKQEGLCQHSCGLLRHRVVDAGGEDDDNARHQCRLAGQLAIEKRGLRAEESRQDHQRPVEIHQVDGFGRVGGLNHVKPKAIQIPRDGNPRVVVGICNENGWMTARAIGIATSASCKPPPVR